MPPESSIFCKKFLERPRPTPRGARFAAAARAHTPQTRRLPKQACARASRAPRGAGNVESRRRAPAATAAAAPSRSLIGK
jgi:hypothetical protein